MLHISENYSLLPHNTFHIPAQSKYFIEYSTENDLKEALKLDFVQNEKLLHIGKGSNILFTTDYDGTIMHSAIKGIEKIEEDDQYIILKSGAGEVWDDFVAYCVSENIYGSENLSLIPGEVGAAAVQNIGAYGIELKDIVLSIEAIEIATGQKRIFTNEECRYAYRESIFKKELKDQYIITYVVFKLSKSPILHLEYGNIKEALSKYPEINLNAVRETIISIRESKLPDTEKIGNAGSFFMNPYLSVPKYLLLKQEYPQMPHYSVSEEIVKVPAAWLIEQCGWKGKIVGNAGVHEHQSLVLINRGNATAAEIIELSNLIIKSVIEKFDIDLIPEVIFI